MGNLESRVEKLESVQVSPRREYTDAERAVRYGYLQEQGGPDADKARELLEKVQGGDHAKP